MSPLFIYYRSSGEKLTKYQANTCCVIMFLILITTLFYKASLLQGEIWCLSLLVFKGLNGKKEIPNSLFQVLEGGLVGGKILKSFSVTQQTSYTSSNSSCTILLWMEILWFTKRPIFDSKLWINAEALLGGDTASVHINYNHSSRHY